MIKFIHIASISLTFLGALQYHKKMYENSKLKKTSYNYIYKYEN